MAEDRELFREAMDRIGWRNPVNTSRPPSSLRARRRLAAARQARRRWQADQVRPNGRQPIRAARNIAAQVWQRRWRRHGRPARHHPPRPSRWAAPAAASPTTARSSTSICRRGIEASPTSRSPRRRIRAGLEGIRDGGRPRQGRQLHHHLLHRERRPDGRAHRRLDHRRPALTLTDKEYQIMRNASIAVLREIGVETGGSNVQWAVNPEDGRMVVIEMNPRVSAPPRWPPRPPASRSPRSRRSWPWATRWTSSTTTSPAAHAGLLRADHRLRGHQDPALRLREVPRLRARC
jgi:carbamoyl-phosphate synthase large subunit